MTINQETIKSIYEDNMKSIMKLSSYAVILDNLVSSGLTLSQTELADYLVTLSLDIKQASNEINNSIDRLGV